VIARDIWLPGRPDTRRLVLLRHGRTEWNAVGRAQGHANVSLDAVGRAEAARAAPLLASYRPDFVWSSDLARARETAEALVGLLPSVDLVLDKRLREFDVGLRQGLTFAEFEQQHPDVYARFVAGAEGSVPGAESIAQVAERMVDVLGEATEAVRAGQTGVVVGHGASLRTGLLAFLGVPPHLGEILAGMANCAWAVLQRRGGRGWQIVDYNAHTLPEPVEIADDPHG
jgi:glucosyl-3-phosphoglycerate phosphatase